jgi:ABC-type uncharacterized transport system substrate-binding protein
VTAFQQHLRELGWVEGQNLTIEWRWAEGSLDRFATLVEEMVRLPVEVMVVPTLVTAELAQKATTTIPIVIMGAGSFTSTAPPIHDTKYNISLDNITLMSYIVSCAKTIILGKQPRSNHRQEVNDHAISAMDPDGESSGLSARDEPYVQRVFPRRQR